MIRVAQAFLSLLLFGAFVAPVVADTPPEKRLAEIIYQLQTGTATADEFAPQMWKTITGQTGGTARYQHLEKLGIVTGVHLVETRSESQRTYYSMTAVHELGTSTWQYWIAKPSGRIDWISFHVADVTPPSGTAAPGTNRGTSRPAGAPGAPTPAPAPVGTGQAGSGTIASTGPVSSVPTPAPRPTPPATKPAPPPMPPTEGGSTSEACKRFPNLC